MRHFAHHIGDYAAATAHLSFVEDAAYHRLLRRYYQDEKALPTELCAVQRLVGARSKEEREAVKNVLEEFFTLTPAGWQQSRAAREIEGYQMRALSARENGVRGGRPSKPKSNPQETERVFAEKLTSNQEPITSNQPKEEGAVAPRANQGANDGRRGTRLAADWQPSTEERGFASDLGIDPDSTADTFRDYWVSVPGAKGRKLDWPATWRGWCRRDAERRPGSRAIGPLGHRQSRGFQPPRGNDAFYERLADIASRPDD